MHLLTANPFSVVEGEWTRAQELEREGNIPVESSWVPSMIMYNLMRAVNAFGTV